MTKLVRKESSVPLPHATVIVAHEAVTGLSSSHPTVGADEYSPTAPAPSEPDVVLSQIDTPLITPPQDAVESQAQQQQPSPWILKRLTQLHKDAITLSLQGLPREKVAEFCNRTPAWVTMVCKQPLARLFMKDLEQHLDLRLRGLYEKSINAIEAGLTGPRISDKLAAAQLHLTTIGKMKPPPDESKETAEDVVAAMLVQGTNVQVNINRR
jgi:hypothetical protein